MKVVGESSHTLIIQPYCGNPAVLSKSDIAIPKPNDMEMQGPSKTAEEASKPEDERLAKLEGLPLLPEKSEKPIAETQTSSPLKIHNKCGKYGFGCNRS